MPPTLVFALLVCLGCIAAGAVIAVVVAARQLLEGNQQPNQRATVLLAGALIALVAALVAIALLHPSRGYGIALGLGIVGAGLHVLRSAVAAPRPLRDRRRVKQLAVAAVALVIVGLAVPKLRTPASFGAGAIGGYAPSDRPVFDCLHRGRDCPGPDYVVFNSYVNTPNYHDERAFFDARPIGERPYAPNRWRWHDVLHVKPGDRLLLRIYYDNDADARAETISGGSVAHGTRAFVLLPHTRARALTLAASISATNAHPSTVSDTVTLRSKRAINVLFVPGTIRLYNRARRQPFQLGNDLFSARGALIGYQRMDGTIRGSFYEAGFIIFELRVL